MPRIGHRGASGYELENTAKSIQKALELRVDMIELDVRQCATGELVVFHDSTVKRITNGTGAIRKMSWAELKQLRTKDGQTILSLEEALDLLNEHCWINLDIKSRGVAKTLVELLQRRAELKKNKLRQFLISSFNHAELRRIKKLEPSLRIGLLYHRHILNVLKKAKKMGAYSVHFNVHYFSKKLVKALHDEGIKTFVWTVNNPHEAKRLYKLGIDGVISDFPDIV